MASRRPPYRGTTPARHLRPSKALRRALPLAVGIACVVQPACSPSADLEGSAGTPPDPSVLIVGGGSSHDFDAWYRQADSATLAQTATSVRYTDSPTEIPSLLADVDVLYLANNQPLPTSEIRDAVFAHVAAGKGLIVGHAGSWYNWSDWPEYNRALIGGGTRAHRRFGEFTVEVVAPDHPVMQEVPASFTLDDELYRFMPDSTGSAITVLATAREEETDTTYPIVWTIEDAGGRIVVNTLGHDGGAHEHPAYQTILRNSLRWASSQED